ncbi:hypothetical protein [Streptomyces hydrogenans]|uniref:hypothetical protein n=1 Tax=Streptomyces hydrogenans TaxID=1873719 RepID=UPI0035D9F199
MTDIKIGDRVRVVKDDPDYQPGNFVGRLGRVMETDSDSLPYRVELDDPSDTWADGAWWCEKVELVDEAPTNDAPAAPPADRAFFLRQARELLDGQTWTAYELMALADDLQGKVR